MVQMKQISRQSIIGQQGANLIERIVLHMKNVWRPLVIFDVGIDGEIEICDPNTGAATNCIIRVQAKATTLPFQAESENSFEYRCEDRDINYWLNGNAPVILIVCRPSTDEAYWIRVRDYFSDPIIRKSGKIIFDKKLNRFDETCANTLTQIALPKDRGIYFAPLAIEETLYSNLLSVSSFAPNIWIASTNYRQPGQIWAEFKSKNIKIGTEWLLKNKQIISFHNLEENPFNTICDNGTIERFDASEWASAVDIEKKNDFIQLLKLALKERARLQGLYHDRERDYFYFPPTKNLRRRTISYISIKQKTSREVFKAYGKQVHVTGPSYCRHSAFKYKFLRLNENWYLEITPTYHFTWDGVKKDMFGSERLKGIKQLERNPAVIGQLLMWVHFLSKPLKDMFTSEYPFLNFGTLEKVTVNGGIPDDMWYNSEEGNQAVSLKNEDNQISFLSI